MEGGTGAGAWAGAGAGAGERTGGETPGSASVLLLMLLQKVRGYLGDNCWLR